MLTRIARALRLLLNHGRDKEFLRWHIRHRKNLAKFRDRHAGQHCFIIGNGPSLNKMDLSKLNGCHCFGLNKIHLMLEKGEFNITYHVAVNPLVIEQSLEQFRKLGVPSFLSYRECRNLNIDESNFYFLMTSESPFVFRQNVQDVLFEGFTVTYVAMQLAYFMGFTRVYLIGVDHNFAVQGKPNEKQTLLGPDPNHFHPDYFAGKEWHLPDLEGSELAYRLAKFHFERKDRRILDATVDGKLNVFSKIAFQEAVESCKRSMEI